MAKWKYQNPQEKRGFGERLYIEPGTPVEILITGWVIVTNPGGGPSFTAYVEQENGEKVDKIWSTWDYDLKENMKKLLKGKNADKDKVKLKVLLKRNEEEMEDEYVVELIKE
ncbi:hypothetical protein HOK51_11640 [Candidatus Woesearchaeota archaeon]|jgi:hypothetical protein|nr:hypothetical protein [Candidatus Woesearchaeota archaeon]MBT7368586.1 hypothetical protein [Candidatus Woesearchaeota archaeon]